MPTNPRGHSLRPCEHLLVDYETCWECACTEAGKTIIDLRLQIKHTITTRDDAYLELQKAKAEIKAFREANDGWTY